MLIRMGVSLDTMARGRTAACASEMWMILSTKR